MSVVFSNYKVISLIVVAVVLMILTGIRYIDFEKVGGLPLPGNVEKARRDYDKIREKYKSLLIEKKRREKELTELRQMIRPFFWPTGGRAPSAVFQSKIDNLAQKARVQIRTLGSPEVSDFSDNIRSVELTLRMQATMGEIKRFLEALQGSPYRIFWKNCMLRPDNVKQPRQVSLNARLQALIPAKSAEQILFDSSESEKRESEKRKRESGSVK